MIESPHDTVYFLDTVNPGLINQSFQKLTHGAAGR